MKLAEIKVSYSSCLKEKIKISSSKEIYPIALANWDLGIIEFQEEAKVILLNKGNFILGIYNLSKGGISQTLMDIRIILSVALKTNSSSIIILHNHPSGNLTPSQSDINITKRIKACCNLMEFELLDHLIITRDGYYSFADNGYL